MIDPDETSLLPESTGEQEEPEPADTSTTADETPNIPKEPTIPLDSVKIEKALDPGDLNRG